MDMNEVSKFEQKVGTLKLSEAIRQGARNTKKCERSFTDSKGGYCAIGAAAKANGYADDNIIGFANALMGRAPLSEIYAMNDHGHTREEIADWLQAQGL